MARSLYASTPSDFVIDVTTGRPRPNTAVTVWTARTGGTRITDLLSITSTPVTSVVSNNAGFIIFYGPENRTDALWLDTGTGSRSLARVVNDFALKSDLTTIQTTLSAIQAQLTGYVEEAVVNASGDLIVGTGVAQVSRLPKGSEGQLLTIVSDLPQWADVPTIANVSVTAGSDVPVGTILIWPAAVAPAGYMLCTGLGLNRADYPELYAVIGNTYGYAEFDSDSPTNLRFNIPDFRTRVPTGLYAPSDLYSFLGASAGIEYGYLTVANLPAHSHTMAHTHSGSTQGAATSFELKSAANGPNQGTGYSYSVAAGINTGASWLGYHNHTHTLLTGQPSTSTTGTAGTGTGFDIHQPYIVQNFIIKVESSKKSVGSAYWPVWIQDVTRSLTTNTALTQVNGTWSVDSGQLKVVGAGSTTLSTARTNTAYTNALGYVTEIEFEVQASFDGATEYIGVSVGGATASGGVSFRVSGTGNVSFWAGATEETTALSIGDPLTAGWHKIKIELNGPLVAGYIDDVLVARAAEENLILEVNDTAMYAGFLVYGTQTVRWRGLAGYSLSSGLPSGS